MQDLLHAQQLLTTLLGDDLISSDIVYGELTCEVQAAAIDKVGRKLCEEPALAFKQLIDLCGVDYTKYGEQDDTQWQGDPFAVVYHLQSIDHNQRIRLRAGLQADALELPSVIEVWPVADWFEREAFDLFGIVFTNHPDLRRLLTDYGFIGHPFRKDFPLSGQVEMRYDEDQNRVVYQPVTVDDRILVPRVIRRDNPVVDSSIADKPQNNSTE